MVWDRGFWDCEAPKQAYSKGKLDFTLEGEKLHGGWILTRMRQREGEKRTNWLLIKHRDAFAREGKKNRVLDEDRSVASGRSMDEITESNGRKPKPFATAKTSREKVTVQRAPRRAAAKKATAKKNSPLARRSKRPAARKSRKKASSSAPRLPSFIAPQLCRLVDRPPSDGDWVHEIKFDGYRIQMRVEQGKVTLKTRKGLDWTDKFKAIATAARALPDCILDGEIVALDHRGSPDFAGLQAALSEKATDDLIFYAFDLLYSGAKDLRRQSLLHRKQSLKRLIEKTFGPDQVEIRFVEHFESGVMLSSNPLAGCRSKASSQS